MIEKSLVNMATSKSNDLSDNEDENFEDAFEDIPVSDKMDLPSAIEETTCALNLFLNNHFNEAKARMEPWAHGSMYHALGFSTVCYLQAVMTFDPQDIQIAIHWIKNSIDVSNRFRRRGGVYNSVSNMVRRPNYDNYTDEEVHSELCYAESLLERAILTFIQDDNLISFLKGGLKIRNGYQSYKTCVYMLENRQWKDKNSKMHFESGVKFGIGCFNLMISMLPRKVLKLLEFVGFSGNRQFGLSELERGNQLPSLRSPLCSSVLIGYHTIATYVLGMADGDIQYARDVLQPCLYNYPKGVIFLFYAGRIEEITGNLDEAIVKFEECIASQQEWKQFHHICYWELMWCHAFKMDWIMAAKYADLLCQESKWSKATYYYQQASFLSMQANPSQQVIDKVILMYHQVPELKQRIAGKSIPVEKFAVTKSKKFLLHGIGCSLAGLELVYVWNGFSILGKKKSLVEPVLLRVESTLGELKKTKESNPSYVDDYCLAMLLKGMCLRCMNRPSQAELCFQDVIDNERGIECDNYLSPYATMELGLLYLKHGRYPDAKLFLLQAKTHKKYMLENRLHFRLHAALQTLKSKMAGGEDVDLYDGDSTDGVCPSPVDGGHSDSGQSAKLDQATIDRSISADEGLGQTAAERTDDLSDEHVVVSEQSAAAVAPSVDVTTNHVNIKMATPEIDDCVVEDVSKLSLDHKADVSSVSKPNSKGDVAQLDRDCNSNDMSL